MDQHAGSLRIHTLGPSGTNCEAAAYFYLEKSGHGSGQVLLYETLEEAVIGLFGDRQDSALLGCVVYPRLNEIVFKNVGSMTLRECFVMPTHPMVLAGTSKSPISTVTSHPAPVHLLDDRDVKIKLVNSNSAAAIACAAGDSDACITTMIAAKANNLIVLEDFGPVPMGFTIHTPNDVAL